MALTIRTTGLEQYAPGGAARVKVLLIGGPSSGKRIDVNARVATPTGWRRLGDLVVGDQVIGSDGSPTTVLGVYDQGVGPAYRVTLNDGGSVIADGEHLWAVQTRKLRETGGAPIVLTTQQILDRGVCRSREDRKDRYEFYLPIVQPVQYDKVELPIGPYLLGSLLANGSFTTDSVMLTTNDPSVAQRCRDENPELDIAERTSPGYCRRWRIKGMHKVLQELGIDRLKSGAKFVPPLYMTAHEQARRDLLAGLMDGDGSAAERHRACFHTTSPMLAADVQQLVWSLGGVARIDIADRTHEGKPVEYKVRVWLPGNPFTLPRKADRYQPAPWFRAIVSIEPAEPTEMRCIKVDAPDQLYVVEDYIVTHNTRWASFFPKPIYADCEGGLASVADRRVPYVTINTSTDMADFLNHVKMDGRLPEDKRTIQTVVIDTLDAYQRKLKNEWLEVNKKESFSGWEAWGFLDQKMGLLLTKLLNLDVNIIVAVHYKDKVTRDDDKESHELMLQLSGDIKDTAFNDFDLVGFMGTYWEAVAGERVQKRGITFKATPDKPFLKDRLFVTPPWLEVVFADSDYENLFARIAARVEELSPGETLGQIESEQAQTPPTVATPDRVPSGAVAQPKTIELPLAQMDKPTLLKKARDLGVTTLKDGSPIKGNSLKSELIDALEAHADAAETKTQPATQQTPPGIESVAEGVVDTSTGELLDEATEDESESDGPPAVLEAKPIAEVLTEATPEPTHEEAVETVKDTLGGQVISDVETTAAAAALARAQQAKAPAPAAQKPAGDVCTDCTKNLADEDQNYVKLSRIKYRTLLCEQCYIKRKSA